jgi:hypothetical protein
MKKVFLLSLGLVLGLGASAQMRMPKSDKVAHQVVNQKFAAGTEQVQGMNFSPITASLPKVAQNRYDGFDEAQVIMTTQDNQSNGGISNRLVQWQDGSAAVVATFSHEENSSMSDRGTGYNFYNGNESFAENWGEMPEARIESIRTGWPTISSLGANGEVIAWHAGGVFFMKRDAKGQGEWSEPVMIPNASTGEQLTWPRIATSGANNDIIHVVSANQATSGSTYINTLWYSRSTDGGATWTTTSMPGIEEENLYSADDYSIATNGNTVAVLLFGGTQTSVVLVKSTDNGETWTSSKVWENPYEGFDWETNASSIYTDTMVGPANVALAVDYDGVAHVVMSTYEYIHSELGDTYTVFSGRTVDGVAYWNDTQDGPIAAANGNPHDALRMWWPDPENPGYVTMDTPELYKFCGYMPMYDGIEFENENLYDGNDYFYKFYSRCSAQPCISVDPNGVIFVAYSCPNISRANGDGIYQRSVYTSYKLDKNAEEWVVNADDLMQDFIHMLSDGIWVTCSPKAVNAGEFFVSYSEDSEIGIYNFFDGTGAPYGQNQGGFTENYINVVRVSYNVEGVNETVNPMTEVSVYPNPTTAAAGLRINSSMDADAVISLYNITGQMVKSFNKSLSLGVNGIDIQDLHSGVYFCTVSANGFSKTVKFVVE